VTVEGLDWSTVQPGTRVRLGDVVVVEVTRYTSPCFHIKAAFKDGEFARVSQTRHPGWSRVYARVVASGTIHRGDAVRVVTAQDLRELTTP
jgi:MOSC domain-containing protein YiiM